MRFASSVALVLSLTSATAFAWGKKGHQVIELAATGLMESPSASFFQTNKDAMASLASLPDFQWKKKATYAEEAPLHFFQWDRYRTTSIAGSFSRYTFPEVLRQLGADYIHTNGGAVWRVNQIYLRLIASLQNSDWSQALGLAAVMGHYVGDLSQPMHVTSDYDGQSIGRHGVHYYYEVTLVEPHDTNALVDAVLREGGQHRIDLDTRGLDQTEDFGSLQVRDITVAEAQESLAELPYILQQFGKTSQNDDALTATLAPRMGAGAAALAKILDMATVASGQTRFPSGHFHANQLDWFPLGDGT